MTLRALRLNAYRWLRGLTHQHDDARRVEGRRLYLECRICLATTPGIETGNATSVIPFVPATRKREAA